MGGEVDYCDDPAQTARAGFFLWRLNECEARSCGYSQHRWIGNVCLANALPLEKSGFPCCATLG